MNVNSKVWTRVGKMVLLGLTISALAYLLYFHKLYNLLPGYSSAEIVSYKQSLDWHNISGNIVAAPYFGLVWILTALGHQGIGMTRIVAACFGTLAVLLFFFVARLRFSFWVALLGTVLFGTSAGFLHAARLGTPQILQLGILAFMGAVLWYRSMHNHRVILGYAMIVLFGLLWYIPGMIWFQLFGVVLMFPGIRRQFARMSWGHRAGWTTVLLITIAPLIYSLVKHPRVILDIAGLPPQLAQLTHVPGNIFDAIMSVAVRSDGNPLLWVGHAPLLNVVEIALGIIGAYVLLYQERTRRSIFLVGSLVLGIILTSLGGQVTIICIVPILYLIITEGLDNIFSQWMTVFPRNPLAKATGLILVCAMLFFSVLYQTRSYFVAWPHNTNTRQEFNQQPPA